MGDFVGMGPLAWGVAGWLGLVLYSMCGATLFRLNASKKPCQGGSCDGSAWCTSEYSSACVSCGSRKCWRWGGVFWPVMLAALLGFHAIRVLVWLPINLATRAIAKPTPTESPTP